MRFATIAISVFLVWALPSAAAQARAAEPAPKAGVAAKKAALKKSLKKDLKKCRTFKKKPRRKACVRLAKKRYAKKLRKLNQSVKPEPKPKPKPGAVHRVDVIDDYFVDLFSPDYLEIKSGDVVEWIWNDNNQNPHNVTLEDRPAGVDRQDYMTPNAPSRNYRWSRQLVEVGTWQFACSLHKLMRMTVKVEK